MSDLEFWKDLGNIFDAVLSYQKKNVEFNNRFINPWIRIGNIFERGDQHTEAVQAYRNAAEIDPQNAQRWLELGEAQFKAGALDDAVDSYKKAIELDPEAGWPLGNLALTYVTQGKVQDAIPLYLKSIELLTEPKDKAVCWNRLGNAYRKLDDYQNALIAFQKADELDKGNTGFADKLDEPPAGAEAVNPESVLEQVIVEEPVTDAESESPAVAQEPVAEAQAQAQEESAPVAEAESPEVAQEPVAEVEPVVESQAREESAPAAEVEPSAQLVEAAAEESQEEAQTEVIAEPVAEETALAEESALPVAVEGAREASEETAQKIAAPVEAAAEQSLQTEAEAEPLSVIQTEEGQIAIAPNMEMRVEEESAEAHIPLDEETQTGMVNESIAAAQAEAEVESSPLELHEQKFDAVKIIEEVIAKVEEQFAAQEASAAEEKVEAVSQVEAVEESAPAMTEEECQPEESSEEQPRVPAWLVIKNKLLKKFEAPEEAQQDTAEVTAVAPYSESVSEAAVQMDVVETYSSPLIAQDAPAAAQEEDAQMEVESESGTVEPAYDEYLEDVVEPTRALASHSAEAENEAPVKVSENGEVRLPMDTKNAHVWNELGNVYMNAGAYDEAIVYYSKAIEIDHHFAWPYSNLALAYVQKGRFAEAILLYQRSIELFVSDKDKAITWNRLGNVYRRINDYDNAIASYKIADELDPDHVTLSLRSNFGLLGNMYAEQKPAYAA